MPTPFDRLNPEAQNDLIQVAIQSATEITAQNVVDDILEVKACTKRAAAFLSVVYDTASSWLAVPDKAK